MKLQLLSSTKNKFLKDNDFFAYLFVNDYDLPEFAAILQPNFSEIGINVDSLKYEDIDKSNPWLVGIKLLPWHLTNFNYETDILDYFSDEIKYELLNGSAYFLIDNSAESHTLRIFKWIHQFLKNTKLPANKIIYMSHSYKLDMHYNNFCLENNISSEDKISTIYSGFCFSNFISDYDLKFYQYNRTKPKSKIYLFLNRVDRVHRLMMVSMLSYYDLLRHGYVSLGSNPNVNNLVLDTDIRLREGFEKIKHKFPLVLDTHDFENNILVGMSTLPMEYYQDTYFSLVSSTHALSTQEKSTATNEKELKPILAKQPFIIWGRPYALESMRDMGFMTFSKWFDESYDTETDDIKRMEKIVLEIRRLTSLSSIQWEQILKEMEPVILHNYNRLTNYFYERYYFSSDLKKFLLWVA